MIKRWLGLGPINDEPFSVTGLRSTTKAAGLPIPGGARVRISVDHSQQSLLGNAARRVQQGAQASGSPPAKPAVVVSSVPVVYTQESARACANALFRDFKLEAKPVYNFWTPDETTNDLDEIGHRKLEDVPRFVKISWNIAPDLPGFVLNEVKQKGFRNPPRAPIATSYTRGVVSRITHLTQEGFAQVANATVNHGLAQGTMDVVMELPRRGGTVDDFLEQHLNEADEIDEDLFLTDSATEGMNLNELRANVQQIDDQWTHTANLSTTSANRRGRLFDGRFLLRRRPGAIRISGIDPSLPGIVIDASVAHDGNPATIDRSRAMASSLNRKKQPSRLPSTSGSIFVPANFVDMSFTGVVSEASFASITKLEHAETVVSLAPLIPVLSALSTGSLVDQAKDIADVVSKLQWFQSPDGVKQLEYVGYVLEKYELSDDGSMTLVDTFNIPDPSIAEYYDAKVKYGQLYRYRIRAIARWTRAVDSENPLVVSDPASQTARVAQYKSCYLHGEWSLPYYNAMVLDTQPPLPPDELTVRPDSANHRIVVSMRVNRNKRDVDNMVLFRKLKDANGNDLTNWELTARLEPSWGLYVDHEVDFFEDVLVQFVYCAATISKHGEMSLLSEQYAVKLNRNFATFGEYPVTFVSNAGVDFYNFGAWATNPNRIYTTETIVPRSSQSIANPSAQSATTLRLGGRNAVGVQQVDDASYVVRVESLDTGQIADTQVNLRYTRLVDQRRQVASPNHLVNGATQNAITKLIGKTF